MDTASLLLGVVFSSIGVGYFMYGKRRASMVTRYCGVALMVFPYFVPNNYAVIAVGCGLMALPKFVDF